jgi:hypothetical protein
MPVHLSQLPESVKRRLDWQTGSKKPTPVNRSQVDIEADLHNDIIAECKRRGFPYRHGSMAHKTKRTPGEPDFDIYLPNGVKLEIECKTEKGELSPAQALFHESIKRLGHVVYVIRSLAAFDALVKSALADNH